MTQPATNPLSASEPWNLVADGYAETTMLVFEEFADEAIAASKLKPNPTVLDVACGPGTLALRLAQHAEQVHGIDFSESMLAVFSKKIEQAGHRNIALHCGDAQTLPYADETFDTAFSLFGLMARERKIRTGLAGRITYAEDAADFGCVVGGGVKIYGETNAN